LSTVGETRVGNLGRGSGGDGNIDLKHAGGPPGEIDSIGRSHDRKGSPRCHLRGTVGSSEEIGGSLGGVIGEELKGETSGTIGTSAELLGNELVIIRSPKLGNGRGGRTPDREYLQKAEVIEVEGVPIKCRSIPDEETFGLAILGVTLRSHDNIMGDLGGDSSVGLLQFLASGEGGVLILVINGHPHRP